MRFSLGNLLLWAYFYGLKLNVVLHTGRSFVPRKTSKYFHAESRSKQKSAALATPRYVRDAIKPGYTLSIRPLDLTFQFNAAVEKVDDNANRDVMQKYFRLRWYYCGIFRVGVCVTKFVLEKYF